MLVAAAVCPQTPLLVPEVAGGAAKELADVREASLGAVSRLRLAQPDVLIAVAVSGGRGARKVRLGGSFRRFGIDVAVGDGAGLRNSADVECGAGGGAAGGTPDGAEAPIGGVGAEGSRAVRDGAVGVVRPDGVGGGSAHEEPCAGLLVGRWLLDSDAQTAALTYEGWEIGEDTEPGECERIGREFAARTERVALLIMGDGSARRGLKAPGYLDDRAIPFDDDVARALAAADTRALAAIDVTAASDLLVAGRAPWQVLAGAVDSAVDGGGQSWRGELLAYSAPYGVGYFTAIWTPQE